MVWSENEHFYLRKRAAQWYWHWWVGLVLQKMRCHYDRPLFRLTQNQSVHRWRWNTKGWCPYLLLKHRISLDVNRVTEWLRNQTRSPCQCPRGNFSDERRSLQAQRSHAKAWQSWENANQSRGGQIESLGRLRAGAFRLKGDHSIEFLHPIRVVTSLDVARINGWTILQRTRRGAQDRARNLGWLSG